MFGNGDRLELADCVVSFEESGIQSGDLVEIRDGSHSILCQDGVLTREYGLSLQRRTYVVLLVQDHLPAWQLYSAKMVYTNNILLQDVTDPNRLVFTRVDFVRPVTVPSGHHDLATALAASRKICLMLFGTAEHGDLVYEMATILQQPPTMERVVDFGRCIVRMRDRLA